MAGLTRGDIVWCDLEAEPSAGEAGHRRPVLVVSSDRMPTAGPVVVLPLTTTPHRYPTVIELEGVLPRTSYLQCEQIRAVSRSRLGARVGRLDEATLHRAEAILRRILEL